MSMSRDEIAPREAADGADAPAPERLPLDAWHRARGARMVPFAGYEMPIQYEGIIAEHLWTRTQAGLFDVSHMGQLFLSGEDVDLALEALSPGDIKGLAEGRLRYSLLLADNGGILDDLMVTRLPLHNPFVPSEVEASSVTAVPQRPSTSLGTNGSGNSDVYMVVNGATKWDDIAHLREHLPDAVTLNHLDDRVLLALQGPGAAAALARVATGEYPLDALVFMTGGRFELAGAEAWISRSGYTGEDGFEISLPAEAAEAVATLLCEQPEVKPIGLGARDSLRLEAGLPLYGHDLDPETTPIAADLGFALAKRRREEGGFPGHARIMLEREQGSILKRVGLTVEGRQPVREGALVLDGQGSEVGRVTSGGFSPSRREPIAMAYVPQASAAIGSAITLEQRGKLFKGTVVPLPFVPHRYVRKGA